jgi:hypothetical protein
MPLSVSLLFLNPCVSLVARSPLKDYDCAALGGLASDWSVHSGYFQSRSGPKKKSKQRASGSVSESPASQESEGATPAEE